MIVEEYDLNEAIEELEEEVSDYEASQADIEREARGLMDEPEESIEPLREAWEALESKRVETQGQVDRLKTIIDEYGGSTWRFKELTIGDIAHITDSTGIEVDAGDETIVTGEGAAMNELIRRSIQSAPPDAPDVTEYPILLGTLLRDAIENLNKVGDVDVGNRSFGEVMTSTGSSQTSSTEDTIQTTST